VLSERRASVDSSLGGCFADQTGKHIECGVDPDVLVVGARPTRIPEE
jgi:hypothetical protein